MRESVEFIELTSLEKMSKDRWKFCIKPNPSFDRMFGTLIKHLVFHAATIYETNILHNVSISTHFHIIDDEGIWLLSHVFHNWDEMFEQATKKSPWEQSWQERTEQKRCDYCDLIITSDQLSALFCKECQKDFHYTCYYEHIDQKPPTEQGEFEQKKDVCMDCGKPFRDRLTDKVSCSECSKTVCLFCWEKHFKAHQSEKKQEETWPRQCAHCAVSIGSMTAFSCKTCHKKICVSCSVKRCPERAKQTEGNQSYTYRQEYGSSPFDDIVEKLKRTGAFREAFSGTFRFSNFDTFQQQVKEEEERARQQAYNNFKYQSTSTKHGPFVSNAVLEAFKQLGLAPTATIQEIRSAFRAKAKVAHPDTGGSDAAFKKLNDAYQTALKHAERANT